MRRLSIKSRVALWYAFSMLAFLLLVVALLLAAGDQLVSRERKTNLMTVTDRAVDDVRILDGKMSIDDDISYYSDGTYVVIYRDDGTQISGLIPEGFPVRTAFEADRIRKAKEGSYSYFVYDRLIENQKAGKIWIRGITSARLKDIAPSVMRMLKGFLIAIPILFAIALAGGWMMTRQAFAPLKQIVGTAKEIRGSGKLDRRIGLSGSDASDSDEIRRTAAVFDEMLDQIEKDFNREKQFTNDASHELRTPVSVILAQSEYAMANMNDSEEVRESLQEIRHQAVHMSSLLSQLLTMARADRGIEQLHLETADIGLLAEESAGRFLSEAIRRHIHIHVDVQECCYILCDPLFISRMFDNLIDNSLKYGRTGGRTEVFVRKDEDTIRIMIRDDGMGIHEEDLPRIWDRFYRGCHTDYDGALSVEDPDAIGIRKEDEARSMGLGLSMAAWIVEAHHGEIRVESQPEKGSSFYVYFPCCNSEG